MAWRRASFASLAVLRSSAVMWVFPGPVNSDEFDSSVHWGQRLAKPGLSGFSSNSSLQMAQTLMGKGIFSSMIILIREGLLGQNRSARCVGHAPAFS